ncbi:glutamate-1-semialdehyde 2,1-aminomutase [Austwickia chelonae]|uniref:Putative aminotransferase n=1 Tax=Austwickia chelonae NBRC 105200 TaxID=1184607 RepID=K6VKC4_9MICO|nr:aminotransferase class III-fold pyridoxal phosphate-dependent enzyme [Austwickia chelonae]GAB77174.1 putative aminotransferase [Austwickia chelonae NBRC 105200]SEW04473.1 glutamate-1-semialdehyde 2,1-aminomutase [Austwickia chelonae]
MQTYEHPQSRALFERALKVVPSGIYGHLGPSEGCYIPVSAYPFYAARAHGAYVWDVDGNRYIDYMCAYGPNILGYGDPDVDAAARAQIATGNCTTLPTATMVELAELLVDTVDGADWAFFAKNGGDTTSLAMMIARAATGRDKAILFRGHYHGVAPWTQQYGSPGITDHDVANNLYCTWGDLDALRRTMEAHRGQIAVLMATPYHHPVFADNELPEPSWWSTVRELCTEHGIVLAVDDVRAGFRLDMRGSSAHYGLRADLQCFCKALANGWNVSALVGDDALRAAAGSVMYTGSYWLSSVPFAAAIACLEKLTRIDAPGRMRQTGRILTDGLRAAAAEHGFDLRISGEPAMWFMRIADDDTMMLHQEWIAECVRRGVFFTSHHNLFMNTAITEEDIAYTLDVAHESFAVVRARHPERQEIQTVGKG